MAKKDLKSLKPSLRERKRYLVFETMSKTDITDKKAVKGEILLSAGGLIGDLGLAKAGIRFIKEKENKGMIMVNHNFLDQLRASLALIRSVKGIPVIIRSTGVSGVVNKAEAYL